MEKISVALIDKQPFYRIGICHILSKQPDFQVLDISSYPNPLKLIDSNPPDILLLDIDYPSLSGLEMAKAITSHCSRLKVIMLTLTPHDKLLFKMTKSNAITYLDKDITGEELIKTMRNVWQDKFPLVTTLMSQLILTERLLNNFQKIQSISDRPSGRIITPPYLP